MSLSQQLAAPTNPKINEYDKWEQERDLERERDLWNKKELGGGGRRSGDTAIVAVRYLGSATQLKT